MSTELVIYGAAYGRTDVTGHVRKLRKDQKLTVKASNDVFGDSWPDHQKSLVVVYKYDNGPTAEVQQKVVKEGKTLVLSPPKSPAGIAKDRLSLALKSGMTMSRQQRPLKLSILSAVYGLSNVTTKARSLVTANQEFNQAASNTIWGDGWPAVAKTLVVVYEYSEIFMVDIAIEGETMHFIASPPLTILGAAYGLKSATAKVNELVRNRSLSVTANNYTFGDSWRGHHKTLDIMYQYGEEEPTVATAKESDQLEFIYSAKKEFYGSTNPNILTILGAAYGPKDVTAKVRSLVKDGSTLNVKASNVVFGDPMPGNTKSLVIVYRYGRNSPKLQVVRESSSISVSIPSPQPYPDLTETNDLLEDGDVLALIALNGKFISCDSSNRLFADAAAAEEGCKLTVKKDDSSGPFKIQSDNGKYVIVGADKYLYATGSAADAAIFTVSVSTTGDLRWSTKGMFIRLASQDGYRLKADAVDYLAAYTIFDIALQQTTPALLKQLLISSESLSECDQAMISLIWQLVGGFFLAIGLGPFISIGEARPGVLALVRSNKVAWSALMKLKDVLISSPKNIATAITAGLGVIGVFFKEGLVWTIFKWVLKAGIWWAITKAIAKIIQIVFIPEAEAAALLASFTAWTIQTIQGALAAGQACN